ncbi:MAG: hypothetical protein HOP37_04365 [Cyclobacteriaceae bacterium]|nr:hypothetical protein [Cyclobacteriaceae bacterium]
MDIQVSKSEFKNLYFRFAQPNNGWTADYWNQFFEREQNKNYFYEEPASPAQSQMMIVSGNNKHRMIFLTENSEEAFFGGRD